MGLADRVLIGTEHAVHSADGGLGKAAIAAAENFADQILVSPAKGVARFQALSESIITAVKGRLDVALENQGDSILIKYGAGRPDIQDCRRLSTIADDSIFHHYESGRALQLRSDGGRRAFIPERA